jgi:type I restriction enzyme S subunit
MKKVKLGDVCKIQSGGTPSRGNLNYWNNGNIPWVKISDIKEKHLSRTEEFITQEGLANSSAKIFPKETILYTIFATLGEVSILEIDATTNQAIAGLQIIDENICKDYLYYYLISLKPFVNEIGRGVAQNNINMQILRNFEIPLPSLEEQKAIARKLDKVSGLIEKRKTQLEKLSELVKSRFIEMFGDPVYNPNRLPTKPLAELGSLDRGRSKHRPRNDTKLLGGPYPLIQTGEVSNAGLYITEYQNTYSELGLQQSKMWNAGTLCITIAANIAQTAILTFNACFPDSVVGFIPSDEIDAIYMHYWFSFFQKILDEQAPQVAQKNINLKILSELQVTIPSKEAQQEFVAFVKQTDKSKFEIQKSLEKLETLKKALMQKYFG